MHKNVSLLTIYHYHLLFVSCYGGKFLKILDTYCLHMGSGLLGCAYLVYVFVFIRTVHRTNILSSLFIMHVYSYAVVNIMATAV